MTEEVRSNLIKLISGLAVAVVVIAGVSLFFGNQIISFFKETPDFGSVNEDNPVTLTTPKKCEDCGFFCTKNECDDLSLKWKEYSNLANLDSTTYCSFKRGLSYRWGDCILIHDSIEK